MVGRQTLYRKARREKGLCAEEGCPVHTGDKSYRCWEHSQAHAAAKRLRYWARKAEAAVAKAN